MSYSFNDEKQTALNEVGRISARLKIALNMYIAGRDETCAEMVLQEILKLDELEMFLEHVFAQELDNKANVRPSSQSIN